VLRIELDEEPPIASLPDGLRFRDLEPGRDDRALFDLIDTAFDEWPDRESHGFENWAASTLRREEVKPGLAPLVVDGDRIVGASLTFDYGELDEGWIQQLAVDAAYRGRGLGAALLRENFRRFRNVGRHRAGLSTDSRTGALGLYEHVGMTVRASYTRYAKAL
jgi:ribosomal protein S18 acetylase RimI-like enzyme